MEAGNSRVSRPLRTKWSRSRLPYTPLGQASMRNDEWPRIKYASADFSYDWLGLRKAAKTETGGKYKELRGYCIDFRLTKAKLPHPENRIQGHAFSWKVCGIFIVQHRYYSQQGVWDRINQLRFKKDELLNVFITMIEVSHLNW